MLIGCCLNDDFISLVNVTYILNTMSLDCGSLLELLNLILGTWATIRAALLFLTRRLAS
jgi:hypothetical protein